MLSVVTEEIVYSPSNEHLEELFSIVGKLVDPYLTVSTVANSNLLERRLLNMSSFVGIEFPDWYSVSLPSDSLERLR
jgi:hypothetical protein